MGLFANAFSEEREQGGSAIKKNAGRKSQQHDNDKAAHHNNVDHSSQNEPKQPSQRTNGVQAFTENN
jgi:hypothetical protein